MSGLEDGTSSSEDGTSYREKIYIMQLCDPFFPTRE